MSEPHSVLREDPVMADLIDKHGELTLDPVPNEFRRLCRSIVNQQLSTASANAVWDRFCSVVDDEVSPETLLAADIESLRAAGLSESKVEYIQNAAIAFQDRDLTRDGFVEHSDAEVIDELTQIKGIGEWTARMYLIFALGRPDVLPLGDLGVRNGINQLYGNGESLSRDEMRDIAEHWRPYRSYGTRYIWRAYESD